MAATITANPSPVSPTGTLSGTASFSSAFAEPAASLGIYFYETYPALPAQGSSGSPPKPIGGSYAGDSFLLHKWAYNVKSGSHNFSIYLPSFTGYYESDGSRSIPANANYIVLEVRYAGPSNYEGYYTVVQVQRATLSAPSNLRVNGATSYAGNTAPLTWTAAVGSGASGQVLYDVLVNGGEAIVASGLTGTSYTIPRTYFPSQLTCQISIGARYGG